jgi:RNA polymerase primary sigma factor
MAKNNLEKIIDYINTIFKEDMDAKSTLECFSLLTTFLEGKTKLTIQDCLFLVNNNKLLYKVLQSIYQQNERLVKSGNVDVISKDQSFIQMMRIYCDINNIGFDDLDEDYSFDEFETVDSTRLYNKQIRQFSILSREEEQLLGQRIMNGDKEALNRLVECNLRYVIKIANRYTNKGLSLDDLIQAGSEGLIKAAGLYDATKGFRFLTYATAWIEQAITRTIANTARTIRYPVHQVARLRKYYATQDQMRRETGKDPSFDEVVAMMGLNKGQAKELAFMAQEVISLSSTVNTDDDESELGDFISIDEYTPEDIVIEQDEKKRLENLINKSGLTFNEKRVLILKHGLFGFEPFTYRKLSDVIHISYQRLCVIEKQAIRKLKYAAAGKIVRVRDDSMPGYVGYPKDLVDKIISFLPTHEQEIVKKRFCKDGSSRIVDRLSKSELIHFYQIAKDVTFICQKVVDARKNHAENLDEEKEDRLIEYLCRKGAKSFYSYFDYPEELINQALVSLPEDQQEFVRMIYDNELDKKRVKRLNRDEHKLLYDGIIPQIRKIAKKIDAGKPIQMKEKSLYGRYTCDSKVVDMAISVLPEERQKYLKKVYGNGFDKPKSIKITKKESSDLYGIIFTQLDRRVKKIINGDEIVMARKSKSFYEHFTYEPELIDKAISMLPEDKQDFLKRVYGNGFDNPLTVSLTKEEQSLLYDRIKKQMVLRLKRLSSGAPVYKRKKNYKSFYERFPYPPDLIDEGVSLLPEKRQGLLKRLFANGFDKPMVGELTEEEYIELYVYIRQQLLRRINQVIASKAGCNTKGPRNFYERFPYSRELVEEAILALPQDKQEFLVRVFTDGLDKPYTVKLNQAEKNQLYSIIPSMITGYITKKANINNAEDPVEFLGDETDLADDIMGLIETKRFGELLNNFTYKEAIIISLNLGLVDNEKYPIEKISSFFGVSEQYIIDITRKALLLYKEELKEKQDEILAQKGFSRKRKV